MLNEFDELGIIRQYLLSQPKTFTATLYMFIDITSILVHRKYNKLFLSFIVREVINTYIYHISLINKMAFDCPFQNLHLTSLTLKGLKLKVISKLIIIYW